MSINSETVNKLAKLSALKLDEATTAELSHDLSNILDFISQLSEVSTDGVEPMASTVGSSVTPEREDKVTAENDRENLLKNSPKQEMGFFVVPRVVE
ncbi:MAG: Asp-tRNA(Asn)/Glu-tRNA(Gln) amidotransferase GatCAB subunit C [Magnetococcales bacterium]|nr:Asp-tRNA(Asn)/Glu-tRNA(Gln) amidotransferase GatCAB subunit C [Magnetococcales bacterium]PPR18798.1 MAG: Glutamyl-tRNA(Gln) amidotransferase subunit C [Pseudomonadota bacterium]|tara:strand:+ start:1283 stop:1573 length:291 start_codon:yes stop_codon:yes gene_type:complete